MSRKDLAAVRELSAPLAVIEESGKSGLHRWLPQFEEVVGLDTAAIYGVRIDGDTHGVGLGMASGCAAGEHRFVSGLDAALRAAGARWGMYNPDRPEKPQRNRSIALPPADELRMMIRKGRSKTARFGFAGAGPVAQSRAGFEHLASFFRAVSLDRHWQLRMLVCDGPNLLAWVGGFVEEEPSTRQRVLLQALLPALHRRLALDRLMSRGPMVEAALEVALLEISRAAMVVDRGGAIHFANPFARAQLDGHRSSMRATIADAIRAGDASPDYSVSRLAGSGLATTYLLIARARPSSAERVRRAAARWELTPRQSEVLGLLVAGKSNRSISSALGLSERTVEIHVSSLLAKTGTSSRSELASRFWSDS